ncbi:MAG: ADP-ribosylation/crystallin J1, partial [Planctomycetota bacterium]
MTLFRPVGVAELRLIAESEFREFPPRLPDQPIFYPVLHFDYADQIARDWNTTDAASGYAGFVTRFEIDDAFAARYPVQIVGGTQ